MYNSETSTTWTDERVEILKKLWGEGLSASKIANELGGGITRNAVISKTHRTNLEGRKKKINDPTKPRKVRAKKKGGAKTLPKPKEPHHSVRHFPETPPPVIPTDMVVPVSRRLAIESLTDDTCKWPIGEPGTDDFHYCGNSPRKLSSYCEYHSRIAHQTVDRRRTRSSVGLPSLSARP